MKAERLRDVCRNMVEMYVRLRIPMASAALSYFMTLTFFPLLICLYTMLGSLFPATGEILRFLKGILPESTLDAITDYLRYVSENLSTTMSVVAVTVMVTSSAAAFRTIDRVMGQMRGRRRTGVFELAFSFCFSLIFLVVIYFAVLLILTGKWFLDFADRHIMFINISDAWRWARFGLLFLLLFALLSGVYRITAPRRGRALRLLPGAAAASLALVAVSILFSVFIGASARYPLVYGSLASIIIMMLWMYACGIILFLGNALNVALEQTETT